MLIGGEEPREYLEALEALEGELAAAGAGPGRALAQARLGDLHLRWDRPGRAVAAYEAGLGEIGARKVPFLPGKTFRSAARPVPLLVEPVASGATPPGELAWRLRIGAAFGYLAQGQPEPADALIAQVRQEAADPLLATAEAALALATERPDALAAASARLPDGPPKAALEAMVRAPSWEGWPALARAVEAAEGRPRLAAMLWSTWASELVRGGVALARRAAESARGQSPYDEAIALGALGELSLAAGDPAGASDALARALGLWGARAHGLPTDPARVAAAGLGRRARDALIEAALAAGSVERALEAAEDLRAAVLEAETLRPGDDPGSRPFVPRRLVYVVQRHRTLMFSVEGPGEVRIHLCPLGEEALREKILALQLSLRVDTRARELLPAALLPGRTGGPPGEILGELYDALVRPLVGGFGGEEPVVIEPDGPLWALPFAVLGPPGGEPLGARFPLVFGPSAGVVARLRARPPSGLAGALVVGNPDMPSVGGFSLGPLPGAEREAGWLRRRLDGATVWTGASPTLPRVIDAMRASRVIHLGTHGLGDPDQPERAFLAMAPGDGSDGLLTLERLVTADAGGMPMYVQQALGIPAGQEWLDADLVTLSACQTALGQPTSEGVIGLARAFLAVGARTVVASLWNVDDDATAELMEGFYAGWLAGDDPATALHRASGALRERSGDPRLWAPFVVLGAGVRGASSVTTRPGPMAETVPGDLARAD